MQRTTLETILLRLPKLLKDRYGGNANFFWVNAYNDLLTELESTKCGPNNLVMAPVPWQLIQSNELLRPAGISDIMNLYRSTGGEVTWEVAGQDAHILEEVPSESTIVQAVGTFGGSETRMGRDVVYLNDLVGDTLLGDALVVHSSTGVSQPGEYNPTDAPIANWVVSYIAPIYFQGPSGSGVALPMRAGEYDFPVPPTSVYWVFRDYLIVEGHRAYHRVASVADRTSLVPEYDDLVQTYLRYRGEEQTDQFSKNTQDWAAKWQMVKHRWCVDHSRKPASSKRPPPRPSYTPVRSR